MNNSGWTKNPRLCPRSSLVSTRTITKGEFWRARAREREARAQARGVGITTLGVDGVVADKAKTH